ncbi:MAG: O-antigen ligase family protein, partial [Pseudomonadota bacterium]
QFGSLMVFSIPLAMCLVLLPVNILIRILALALVGIMGLVVIKTGSRTCMVSMALSLAIILAFQGRGAIIKKAVVLGVSGIIGIIGASMLPGPIGDRIRSVTEGGESIEGRFRAWEQGFNMVSWYPIFGVGKSQWSEYHGLASHNSFVQVMAETGFIGIGLYFAAIFFAYKSVAFLFEDKHGPEQPKDKHLRQISICVLSSLTVYLLYIFFGNQGWSPWTYFYVGLCAACGRLVTKDLQQQVTSTVNEGVANLAESKQPLKRKSLKDIMQPQNEAKALFAHNRHSALESLKEKAASPENKFQLAPGAEQFLSSSSKAQLSEK